MSKNNKSVRARLSDIADIKPGYPFRGSIPRIAEAQTYVVQVRDANSLGEISSNQLITTELAGHKKPDWLENGDILFVAKGARYFAAYVQDLPKQTVSSPHFFMLRIKKEKLTKVLPKFIYWQLNQLPAQHYFKSAAEGSMQTSIRRQVLEDTPIVLPSIKKQTQLVNLHNAAVKEQKALQKLITNRQTQLDAIALDVLR